MKSLALNTLLGALVALPLAAAAPAQTCYNWKNVRIGGGGGFVPGIIFNPSKKGLAYARTDIGGAYKLSTSGDHTWIPLQDVGVGSANWGDHYVDSLATDPIEVSRVYLFVGAYTNFWDPNNASILRSVDYGATWQKTPLPFKGGGNMPGRGMGERLAIDPNRNNVLYLGTRSGNGLWKSEDYGATWSQVKSFPNVGTYRPNPADTQGLDGDNVGVTSVTFDVTSANRGQLTPRIFVGVADKTGPSIYVTEDAGKTWKPVEGQPTGYLPHRVVLSPKEKLLYITYADGAGPYDGGAGYVQRYNITSGQWKDISPAVDAHGFGGLSVDLQKPGTLMVAALNKWWPDTLIWRSHDSGETWSAIWEWGNYPEIIKKFNYDVSAAPWLYDPTTGDEFYKLVGWMVESLEIDPFDSDHFLYGTGATIFGSRDLTGWDTKNNFTLESLATGVEETAILGLVSPKSGPPLLSAVGDIYGFVHEDLDKSPTKGFTFPTWSTSSSIDSAGLKPEIVVRVGTGGNTKQIAVSKDYGYTWYEHPGAPSDRNGNKAVISADGNTIIWSGSSVIAAVGNGTFEGTSLPAWTVLAADKVAPSTFYAGSGSSFLISNTTGTPSFTASTTPPTGEIRHIAVNPWVAGDVWAITTTGAFRSTDFGKTFTKASTIESGWQIAVGAAKSAGGEAVVFATGVIGGNEGVFRSLDSGKTWTKINGLRGFGAFDNSPLTADTRKYGRVYIGTNGRGIFYADAC